MFANVVSGLATIMTVLPQSVMLNKPLNTKFAAALKSIAYPNNNDSI